LPPQGGAQAIAEFHAEFGRLFLITEITAAILDWAMYLAQRHALCGYDAVQLAAALALNEEYQITGTSVIFISADTELNAAAAAEGLAVENPNDHS
jgi:uncharacterized protein